MRAQAAEGCDEYCEPVELQLQNALVLVPVEAGVGDLSRSVLLNSSSQRIWASIKSGTSPEQIAVEVAQENQISAEQATKDLNDFLKHLERQSFLAATASDVATAAVEQSNDTGPKPTNKDSEARLDAHEFEAVARAVLSAGYRLRFQARGHSMRPWIPDGSKLVVSPVSFEQVRRGEVMLYGTPRQRLVAHRIIGKRDGACLTRGDSSTRLDVVEPGNYLGIVVVVQPPGTSEPLAVSSGLRRYLGWWSGSIYRCVMLVLRFLVVKPLRRSMRSRSLMRKIILFLIRVVGAIFRRLETFSGKVVRRLQVYRAAFLSSEEKDQQRRKLYARKSVQTFTALDENVAAGLTLIEEIMLNRHDIPPGRTLVLGCGPGRECFAFAQLGFEVTGVDHQEGMLESARKESSSRELSIRFLCANAEDYSLPNERFDYIVLFSGLYNMILPSHRRIEVLKNSIRHLNANGRILLTFLSAYHPPAADPPIHKPSWLKAINPDHEDGDLYLINEAVHIFPHTRDLCSEANQAGLAVQELYRDQRAYDRIKNQVRGYVILALDEACGAS